MSKFNESIKRKENDDFPFELSTNPDYPSLQIVIEDVYPIYEPIFNEYGIYGNGPAWDGLIEQALQKSAPELLGKINFNSEGDCCFIEIDTIETGKDIVNQLKDHFNSEANLRSFLNTVNINQLDG